MDDERLKQMDETEAAASGGQKDDDMVGSLGVEDKSLGRSLLEFGALFPSAASNRARAPSLVICGFVKFRRSSPKSNASPWWPGRRKGR